MGLTLALEGASIEGGGISAKAALSSLMAVSTWALSLFDSETYPRLDVLLATTTARDSPRRGAAVTRGLEPSRPADLRAQFAMLLAIMVMVFAGTRFQSRPVRRKRREKKGVVLAGEARNLSLTVGSAIGDKPQPANPALSLAEKTASAFGIV